MLYYENQKVFGGNYVRGRSRDLGSHNHRLLPSVYHYMITYILMEPSISLPCFQKFSQANLTTPIDDQFTLLNVLYAIYVLKTSQCFKFVFNTKGDIKKVNSCQISSAKSQVLDTIDLAHTQYFAFGTDLPTIIQG